MYSCGGRIIGRICIRVGNRCVFNPNPNFVWGTDVCSCGGQISGKPFVRETDMYSYRGNGYVFVQGTDVYSYAGQKP